jgi:hypothetical protein
MQARPSGNVVAALDTLRRGQKSRGTDLTNRVAAGRSLRRALRRLRPPEGLLSFPNLAAPEHLQYFVLSMSSRYKATNERFIDERSICTV